MKNTASYLLCVAKKLSLQEQYIDVLSNLSNDKVSKLKNTCALAELYILRGNANFNLSQYKDALKDYNKAISIREKYALAFFNRGHVWIKLEKNAKAFKDFDKAVKINPRNSLLYVARADLYLKINKYENAIKEYSTAIECDENLAVAYYNRGMARVRANIDLEKAKDDFDKYRLLVSANDTWLKYADYNKLTIDNRLNNSEIFGIEKIVCKILDLLKYGEDEITHYTNLSVLSQLILCNSKFRISEGNFLNDPTEGKDFFKYLVSGIKGNVENDVVTDTYSPKPFIGSFVASGQCDDLNLWRFYGKENGVEANGCAVTIDARKFVGAIVNPAPLRGEYLDTYSQTEIYKVVYLNNETYTGNESFGLGEEKDKKLRRLLSSLQKKLRSYKQDKQCLINVLNRISFLFKNNAYRNECEVRIVVNGFEFEKLHDMERRPHRVYVELVPIKNFITKITFGPKVENINSWRSAFYHSFADKHPQFAISKLPYS